MSNKLIVAAAGSGKTRYIVKNAIDLKDEKVLITTYTESNEAEIRRRIIKANGYVPSHITIQTWFSFLLKHGVRPYQSVLNGDIHEENIGFFLINGRSGAKRDRYGNVMKVNGNPIYWGEDNFRRHYFTKDYRIFSDKISKFIYKCERESKNIVDRISRIYSYVFVDEVQDLAGYDLELLKLFFESSMAVELVGDPRQVTYLTHHSRMNKKYSNGLISDYVREKLGKKITCEIDETSLNVSHRNNQCICDYSARLYPSLPTPSQCNCTECRADAHGHEGVFIIRKSDAKQYLETYEPMQLRWSSTSKDVSADYPTMNFGESKGLGFGRVIIYATSEMKKWIRDNTYELKPETRAKLYVAITRARQSATIVMDYNQQDTFEGIVPFSFENNGVLNLFS